MDWKRITAFALGVALSQGCSSTTEDVVRDDFARVGRARSQSSGGENADVSFDGSVAGYVAFALGENPTLAASYARWAASTHRISSARRMPDPVVSYAFYIQSVETRVGPQRHRLGVRQRIPWPTSLSAGGEAASHVAEAAGRRYEAQALAVERQVLEAYYRLWRVRRAHQLLTEQDQLLDALAESVRARVEVGQAELADLTQLDLRIERHHDHRDAHRQEERAAAAALRAVLGIGPGTRVPTTEAPREVRLPQESERALLDAARTHPAVESFEHAARGHERAAEGVSAAGLPSFVVGFDWIETGEAANPGVQDSGKDPLIVSLSVSVPLGYGASQDAAEARRAEATAERAAGVAARNRAVEALSIALAEVRDSARRTELREHTLLPQAEAAYEAVLGSYQSGRSHVAEVLWAVSALLEITVEHIDAQAAHAIAWARLEHAAGRGVESVGPHEEEAVAAAAAAAEEEVEASHE